MLSGKIVGKKPPSKFMSHLKTDISRIKGYKDMTYQEIQEELVAKYPERWSNKGAGLFPRVPYHSTVSFVLNEMGYGSFHSRQRQALTNIHKVKRVLFCEKWLRNFTKWLLEPGSDRLNPGEDPYNLPEKREKELCLAWVKELNLHFSDEKWYTANYGKSRGITLKKGGVRPAHRHYGQSVVRKMCWLAVGPNGFMAGPRWVDGTIDGLSCIKMLQSTYRDALTKHDLDPIKCLLQQDGAPPLAPAIKGLKGIINFMMHWPPNIPGLNIIETGGGLIAESGNRFIKTVKGLATCVESIMRKDPKVRGVVDALLSSWTCRMRQCVDKRGDRIDY